MNEAKVKTLVRARDGQRCAQCGITNQESKALHGQRLHVHRKVPGSVYTVDGCISLCRACHQRVHAELFPDTKGGRPVMGLEKKKLISLRIEPAFHAELRAAVELYGPELTVNAIFEEGARRILADLRKKRGRHCKHQAL